MVRRRVIIIKEGIEEGRCEMVKSVETMEGKGNHENGLYRLLYINNRGTGEVQTTAPKMEITTRRDTFS